MWKAFGVAVIASACGDNLRAPTAQDAATDPDASDPGLGIELPLLVPEAPDLDFNSSREVSVAARGGIVVIASVNERFPDPTIFTGLVQKRVAVNVSTDGGTTFSPAIDPGHGVLTSDPVVRVSDTLGFTLATLDTSVAMERGGISTSTTGTSWSPIVLDLPLGDKEWFALDDANQQLFVAAIRGCFRVGYDGVVRASNASCGRQIADVYFDTEGAHFATIDQSVVRWSGLDNDPGIVELAPLDLGNTGSFYTSVAWSRAPFPGGVWSVRARSDDNLGSIILRVEQGNGVNEARLSRPGANAFLPTATTDAEGRLHVAYYDSSGGAGRLLYIHSLGGPPYDTGFTEPKVIDPDAVPAGFYPSLAGPDGADDGRRVREYIGIAVDGDVVYIAWTHSPTPPSRVRAVGFRFQ
jgi:hypothetical protein